MSLLKYSWPYIQFLSEEDRQSYVSDLPEDPDSLKVHHIIPSERYTQPIYHGRLSHTYSTPQQDQAASTFLTNENLWGTLYFGTVGKAVWSANKWYNTNIVINYTTFKNQNWASYFKLRFWFIFFTGWTCYHVLVQKGTFQHYPKLIR
jgi:hypothetical protein